MAVVAYGVGIESAFSFDALPVVGSVNKTITIEVRRTSEIKINPGVWVGGGYVQQKHIQAFYHDSHLAYHVDNDFHFELYPSLDLIICNITHDVSDDLLRYWILQQILPFQLQLGGFQEPLHGACVSTLPEGRGAIREDASCIGLMGASHAGKSTLLSHFLSQGHALVADDMIALSTPGYTDVYPALPFYRPYREATALGIRAENYSPQRRPLHRLYLLQPAAGDARVRLEEMSPTEVLTHVMHEKQFIVHSDLAPKFFHLLGDRFRGLARLSREVPAFRLHIPHAMDRLPEVYEFLQQDLVSQQ